jgi:hypothetical protein
MFIDRELIENVEFETVPTVVARSNVGSRFMVMNDLNGNFIVETCCNDIVVPFLIELNRNRLL